MYVECIYKRVTIFRYREAFVADMATSEDEIENLNNIGPTR